MKIRDNLKKGIHTVTGSKWCRYIVFAILGWALVEITSGYPSILHCGWFVLNEGFTHWMLNIFVMLSTLYVIGVFIPKEWVAETVYLVFCFVLAVTNDYMTGLHGSPFSFAELKNIATAANVIKDYHFYVDLFLVLDIVLFLAGLFYILCVVRKRKKDTSGSGLSSRKIVASAVGLLVFAAGYYFLFFAPGAVHPMHSLGGSYHIYGYPVSMVEMTYDSFYKVEKPIGYSEERVNALLETLSEDEEQGEDAKSQTQPDVILILNESFFDLSIVQPLSMNRDPFDAVRTAGDTVLGGCIVPGVGGGTNRSEYELLTGNSLYLIPQDTPFNLLDMNGATSIVSVLKDNGYHTMAMHPKTAVAVNYQRGKQYPAMGFDEVHFEEDFSNLSGIGNSTGASDASVYENLLHWYQRDIEQSDGPQFVYCLTFQNHGGYEQRDAQFDTIQITDDLGDLTDDVNEYLSGVDYSVQAFYWLTEQLRASGRPVIVCMMGDHAPSFIRRMNCLGDDSDRIKRTVPMMWWSNTDADLAEFAGLDISMNYVCAAILSRIEAQALPPVYRYQQQLIRDIPAITAYGFYYDKDGRKGEFNNGSRNAERVQDYFALEYLSITQ